MIVDILIWAGTLVVVMISAMAVLGAFWVCKQIWQEIKE